MSKKKQKTRTEKEITKHDFSHLIRTKTAAKVVEAEVKSDQDPKSPLDREVRGDLGTSLAIIGVFVVFIVALWLLVGKNGQIFTIYDKIKFFK